MSVHFGRTNFPQSTSGGAWLIGDALPDGHPGRSTVLCYKSWSARPDKYASGHYPPRTRASDTFWEYVQVVRGRLRCIVTRDTGYALCCDLHAGSWADVPPHFSRSWELPEGIHSARGVTILRKLDSEPDCYMDTKEYQIRFWEGSQLAVLSDEQDSSPFRRMQFLEVFTGSLHVKTQGASYSLSANEHLFSEANSGLAYEYASTGASGVLIHY